MSFEKVKVYAFVGPSGTGKSYRAQMVASEKGIHFIIDDGLLIKDNEIIAGESAKKAPTKIETVKHALFYADAEKKPIEKAIKKYKPAKILILGTSDGMVQKIAANLGLPEVSDTTYINQVATEEEMQTARHIRVTEGKHVIPVPTFELKKDFSGYLLDPLQIFKSKGIGQKPYISEKTIMRPTFSYLGNFTISDTVFRQIIEFLSTKMPEIYKVVRTRVSSSEIGTSIYMEVVVMYGCNIQETLKEFKENKEYVHMALAVDEFGSVEGLITLNDLLEGIVGDIPGIDETDDPMATQRLDGTWLIDGRFQIDKFKELFDYEKEFPYEKEDQYTTIAGFILSLSGKIPDEKEIYDWDRFHFEILDIDGHQIDKILVTDLGPQEEEKETEEVEE